MTDRRDTKHTHPANVIYSPVCPACIAEWDAAMTSDEPSEAGRVGNHD